MVNVIKVIFINDNHEEFYGSLKAIYMRHTPEERRNRTEVRNTIQQSTSSHNALLHHFKA